MMYYQEGSQGYYVQDESYDELSGQYNYGANEIHITGQDVNLDNSPKRVNFGEFKPI